MRFKKVIIALMSACCIVGVAPTVQAQIKVQDLHAGDGTPALVLSKAPVYANASLSGGARGYLKKGTVVRLTGQDTIQYNGLLCHVDTNKVLTGDELNEYVATHSDKFDKKVTTHCKAKLYDVNTLHTKAIVTSGTSFLIKDEDADFYTVVFDDQEALLYKEDATPEIYVKVTSYDNTSVTIKELLAQLDSIAKALNISADKYKQLLTIDNKIVEYASQFLGNPYVWGGTSLTDGADCSGFVQQVYGHFGIDLPRCSADQSTVGTKIAYKDMQPGDLLFFNRGDKIGHVAIYAGNGEIVHAKGSKYGIVHENLKEMPVVIRRVITTGDLSN